MNKTEITVIVIGFLIMTLLWGVAIVEGMKMPVCEPIVKPIPNAILI